MTKAEPFTLIDKWLPEEGNSILCAHGNGRDKVLVACKQEYHMFEIDSDRLRLVNMRRFREEAKNVSKCALYETKRNAYMFSTTCEGELMVLKVPQFTSTDVVIPNELQNKQQPLQVQSFALFRGEKEDYVAIAFKSARSATVYTIHEEQQGIDLYFLVGRQSIQAPAFTDVSALYSSHSKHSPSDYVIAVFKKEADREPLKLKVAEEKVKKAPARLPKDISFLAIVNPSLVVASCEKDVKFVGAPTLAETLRVEKPIKSTRTTVLRIVHHKAANKMVALCATQKDKGTVYQVIYYSTDESKDKPYLLYTEEASSVICDMVFSSKHTLALCCVTPALKPSNRFLVEVKQSCVKLLSVSITHRKGESGLAASKKPQDVHLLEKTAQSYMMKMRKVKGRARIIVVSGTKILAFNIKNGESGASKVYSLQLHRSSFVGALGSCVDFCVYASQWEKYAVCLDLFAGVVINRYDEHNKKYTLCAQMSSISFARSICCLGQLSGSGVIIFVSDEKCQLHVINFDGEKASLIGSVNVQRDISVLKILSHDRVLYGGADGSFGVFKLLNYSQSSDLVKVKAPELITEISSSFLFTVATDRNEETALNKSSILSAGESTKKQQFWWM